MQVVHWNNNHFEEPQHDHDQHEEAPAVIPLQPEPVDEIINNPDGPVHQLNQDVFQNQQEQVLAMDEFTETDSDVDIQPVVCPFLLMK